MMSKGPLFSFQENLGRLDEDVCNMLEVRF